MSNISYELAKKLKEAGFPNLGMTDHELCVYQQVEIIDGVACHIPSLSELIEACGERIMSIHRTIQPENSGERWCAESYLELEEDEETPTAYSSKGGLGTTPEEAVANLWLKLHE